MSVIVEWPVTWTDVEITDASAVLEDSLELWRVPLSVGGARLFVGEDPQGVVTFRMGAQVSDELGRRIVAAARWMMTFRPAVDATVPNSQG